MPRQGTKAEPPPAVDKTPGPGVNSNKITAVANVSIVQSSLIQNAGLIAKPTCGEPGSYAENYGISNGNFLGYSIYSRILS